MTKPLSAQKQKEIAEQHLARYQSPLEKIRKPAIILLVSVVLGVVAWQLISRFGWGQGLVWFGLLWVGYSLGKVSLYFVKRWAAKRFRGPAA